MSNLAHTTFPTQHQSQGWHLVIHQLASEVWKVKEVCSGDPNLHPTSKKKNS